MTELHDKLPKKLSALLRLSLDDLNKIKKTMQYSINMGHWHFKEFEDKPCLVCLAGSVMAQTFCVDITACTDPHYMWGENLISKNDYYCLIAIDSLREGNICKAAASIDLSSQEDFIRCVTVQQDYVNGVIDYSKDPVRWSCQMEDIYSKLVAVGL